jgi:hypothetical protein
MRIFNPSSTVYYKDRLDGVDSYHFLSVFEFSDILFSLFLKIAKGREGSIIGYLQMFFRFTANAKIR